ncbi:uncharacterized protein C2orf81 homolog [Ctenodactylus gundi]
MAHEGSRQERQTRDRGATRSKAEKARPPTVPVPQVDIVPGRLTEAEWIALTALEEGEDVVGDILADLLARVMDSAFRVYLAQQCVPFTISQAREAMLQIVEWRFLARDEGESAVAEDPTWGEDEEPAACVTDAWAQGSVPVLRERAREGLENIEAEDPGSPGRIPLGRSESWEGSPEPSFPRGPPATPEPLPKAGRGGTVRDPDGQATSQPFVGEALEAPPRPSAGPRPARELSPPGDPGKPQPGAARDRPMVPGVVSDVSAPFSAGTPTALSPAEVVPLAGIPDAGPEMPHDRGGPRGGKERLDPAQLPSQGVCPLAEIVIPDDKVHPWDVYRGRRRGGGAEARSRGCVASGAVFSFQPAAAFRASRLHPRLTHPIANLGPRVPLPGHRHPSLVPAEVAHRDSPTVWPSGGEWEAQLGGELWAGCAEVPPQDLGPAKCRHSEPPQIVPRILEFTSQVPWKSMVLPEIIKLSSGMHMWNQEAQGLLSLVVPQEAEQRPIQSSALKPQVTGAELLTAPPKVWLRPSKAFPHAESRASGSGN